MNKKILIGLVAAVIVAVGAAFFVMNKDDDTTDTANQTNNQTAEQTPFNAKSTEGMSYVATMTGNNGGQSYTATLEYDGKGNSKYASAFGGVNIETYLVDGFYYSCHNATCTKLAEPASAEQTAQYTYSDAELSSLRDSSTYKGKQACGSAQCDVWESGSGENMATVYVASDGRIMKATGGGNGTTYEIIYDYKDVSITAPAV